MRFFAWPIFHLTLLTFRPQKRDKQVAPSGRALSALRAFQLELFWRLNVWCEGRFSGWDTSPLLTPTPTIASTLTALLPLQPSVAPHQPSVHPPPPPPPPSKLCVQFYSDGRMAILFHWTPVLNNWKQLFFCFNFLIAFQLFKIMKRLFSSFFEQCFPNLHIQEFGLCSRIYLRWVMAIFCSAFMS